MRERFKKDYEVETKKLDAAVRLCKSKLGITSAAFNFGEDYNGQAVEIVFKSGESGFIKLINGKARLFVKPDMVEEVANKLC